MKFTPETAMLHSIMRRDANILSATEQFNGALKDGHVNEIELARTNFRDELEEYFKNRPEDPALNLRTEKGELRDPESLAFALVEAAPEAQRSGDLRDILSDVYVKNATLGLNR